MAIKSKFKVGDRVQIYDPKHGIIKGVVSRVADIPYENTTTGIYDVFKIIFDVDESHRHLGKSYITLENGTPGIKMRLDFDLTYYREQKINYILDGD